MEKVGNKPLQVVEQETFIHIFTLIVIVVSQGRDVQHRLPVVLAVGCCVAVAAAGWCPTLELKGITCRIAGTELLAVSWRRGRRARVVDSSPRDHVRHALPLQFILLPNIATRVSKQLHFKQALTRHPPFSFIGLEIGLQTTQWPARQLGNAETLKVGPHPTCF